MRCRCGSGRARVLRVTAVLSNETLMLILVAVRAQELPVASIGRVVVVVVVAMVDFEELQVGVGELAAQRPHIHG